MDRRLTRSRWSGPRALVVALWVVARPAAAGPPPSPPVEEVTVVAPKDPAIGPTYPAAGATVAPGLIVLKVSFTVSMAAARWSYTPVAGVAYPQCLPKPRLLADGRTFVLLCSVAGSTAYAVELNAGAAPGFVGAGGRRAPAFTLRFSTSDAPTTASLPLAMTAASLKDDESPLMGSGDPASPRIASAR